MFSKKKIEVELRLLLKNRREVERRLEKRGARVVYFSRLLDYWFCPQNIKNYRQASVDSVGYCLRLRQYRDSYSDKKVTFLDCKTLHAGTDHALCCEHSIEVNDIRAARKILEGIGFKEFLFVDKERVIYKYRGVKFCFDKIKGLGEGLEMEIMTNSSGAKAAHVKLKALAEDLGIKKSEILDKSLTYLMMKKLARF